MAKSAWTGWIIFAGFLMIMLGSIDAIQGLFAIIEDDYVVATREGLAIIDASGWGWIHLVWGILLAIGGFALVSGQSWARWFTIVAAGLNAISQILFLANYPNAYPLWNITMFALGVIIVYALTVHWRDFDERMGTA
jgi:hypothetical protein